MSARTPKAAKAKGLNSGVVISSCEPGRFLEIISRAQSPPSVPLENNQKKHANGKAVTKKTLSASDRRNLHDIQTFLNNCVNLAHRLETKRAAAIVRLVKEARDEAKRLRG